jgi:hypothetical protein
VYELLRTVNRSQEMLLGEERRDLDGDKRDSKVSTETIRLI